MGTNLGGIPQEYLDAEKVSKDQAIIQQATVIQTKAADVIPISKLAPATNSSTDIPSTNKQNTDQMNTGNSADIPKDIALPNFKNISPSSFFELKREFLSLSENYISRFTEKLNTKKDSYENDESERKARDLFASKKLGNTIWYEQYLYYSSVLKSTNLIYRERIASAVFASKDTFELFYFQVYFAYSFLQKETIITEEVEMSEKSTEKKSTRYAKIEKFAECLREDTDYKKLSEEEQKSLDMIIKNQILFWLRMYNAEAFTNGLDSIISIFERTKTESLRTFHEKVKQSFWILKNDFVDFLGNDDNKAFLIWIHIILDTNNVSKEKKNEKKEAFFRKCHDLLYKTNDFLYNATFSESIYFNDLKKYFHHARVSEGPTINDIIIQLSKHTLYFYLYPIFLYSIAKKVQLSQNDFRILQDSGVLMSSNVEDFVIVSNFYKDLSELINKEKNLGLTKLSFRSTIFHLKQWGIPLISAGILSVLFVLFFRFPLYFAAIWVIYTILYIMSEFLLSYKLKLARVLTGYAMMGLFFLLGGFNINYQQATTDRLAQAHIFLQTGTGTFDVEKAMVQMNTVLDPSSMKTNLEERSGSGKMSGSGGVKN